MKSWKASVPLLGLCLLVLSFSPCHADPDEYTLYRKSDGKRLEYLTDEEMPALTQLLRDRNVEEFVRRLAPHPFKFAEAVRRARIYIEDNYIGFLANRAKDYFRSELERIGAATFGGEARKAEYRRIAERIDAWDRAGLQALSPAALARQLYDNRVTQEIFQVTPDAPAKDGMASRAHGAAETTHR